MKNTDDVKKRIHSLSDEKLLEVLEESTQDYTEPAINIAKEEAKRRGGLEYIKQRLDQIRKKQLDGQKQQEQSQTPSGRRSFLRLFYSLLPKKERFANYPRLYVITTIFRTLAFLTAVIGVLGIMSSIFNTLTGSFEMGIVLLFPLLYLGIAFVTFFTISEVLQLLVDIEKNTRQNNETLFTIKKKS
ncbi:hypothetical protein IIC38_18055 [candidate division KSB1 bacterium]|nr:hypothetical protein [candidate division KSB1 bacterium]